MIAAGAVSGLGKVRADGPKAQLDDDERLGLESVVLLFGRPALLVEDGHFRLPKPPWEKLEEHRAAIESALRSVGRIELMGHEEHDVVGTGFLVGDDIVATNRHVAKHFLVGPPDWPFEPEIEARIDFNEEFLAGEPREFAIREVVGVSLDFDIALFRVAADGTAASTLPPPLPLADKVGVAEGDDVYVIGFPLNDPDPGTSAEALHRTFSDLDGFKRVQPGKVTGFDHERREIVHDCSTLHGNSGSCLIDLRSGRVVGITGAVGISAGTSPSRCRQSATTPRCRRRACSSHRAPSHEHRLTRGTKSVKVAKRAISVGRSYAMEGSMGPSRALFLGEIVDLNVDKIPLDKEPPPTATTPRRTRQTTAPSMSSRPLRKSLPSRSRSTRSSRATSTRRMERRG